MYKKLIGLTPTLLLHAYASGLFPMADGREATELFWLNPETRGVIPLDGFHIPRRLRRTLRGGGFTMTVNQAFPEVMQSCAEPTPGRPETWINSEILTLYTALHHQGHAHSVEVWREERLVGGLYGVSLGAAFFGESMFSRERDASKAALVHLVDRLNHRNFRLLDCQFITDHLRQFGAVEISREEYQRRLTAALEHHALFG